MSDDTHATGSGPASNKSLKEETKEAKADATAELKAAQTEAHSRAAAATSEIKDEAAEFADQARRRAETRAMEAKERVATRGNDMADRLRAAGHEFGDGSLPDRYVGQMADSLSGAADAFANKDIGTLISDTSDFARRNPTAFVGGAALLGFAAARFLKSTEHAEPEPQPYASGGYEPTGYARSAPPRPSYAMDPPPPAPRPVTPAPASSVPPSSSVSPSSPIASPAVKRPGDQA